jgi:TIR domain
LLCGFGLFAVASELIEHERSHSTDPAPPAWMAWRGLARSVTYGAAALVSGADAAAVLGLADLAGQPLESGMTRPWFGHGEADPQAARSPLDRYRIFISYRHETAMQSARQLESTLKGMCPGAMVFRDERSLLAGEAYPRTLRQQIDEADVVLILVDDGWAQRAASPQEVLSQEAFRALQKGRRMIPLLVDGHGMPSASALAHGLGCLSHLHALPLRQSSFDDDVLRLVEFMLAIGRQPAGTQLPTWLQDGKPIEFRTGSPGQGTPAEDVVFAGHWECMCLRPAKDRTVLRFELHDDDTRSFKGELSSGWLSLLPSWVNSAGQMSGTWRPIVDAAAGRVLGIHLEGQLSMGVPFVEEVPLHERQGGMWLSRRGEVTWTAKRQEPDMPGL